MGGTLFNLVTVILGSGIGLFLGNRLSERMQASIVTGVGLVTFVIGMENALKTGNIIIPLLAIVTGVIVGESLDLNGKLDDLAQSLQKRYAGASSPTEGDATSIGSMTPRQRFITGFITASLVFCVGPLAFLGAIQDGMGLAAGFQFLAIKSVLDFFASMAFAASFGIGVMFSALTVLVVQGSLSLMGFLFMLMMNDSVAVANLGTNPMIAEMTAVGGLLLMGLSLILLDIKHPRIANFLPALLIAPALVFVAQSLGIVIYPL